MAKKALLAVSPKRIQKITVFSNGTRVVVHDRSKGKRKQSRTLKPMEKAQRRMAEAMQVGSEDYLRRHERSNRKKRDGWARDMSTNVYRASRKGLRRIDKSLAN